MRMDKFRTGRGDTGGTRESTWMHLAHLGRPGQLDPTGLDRPGKREWSRYCIPHLAPADNPSRYYGLLGAFL